MPGPWSCTSKRTSAAAARAHGDGAPRRREADRVAEQVVEHELQAVGVVPRRFAALSDRLTTQNGIVLMGAASLAALFYTRGDVGKIVVMYSINVF
jgi:hypothetical protein